MAFVEYSVSGVAATGAGATCGVPVGSPVKTWAIQVVKTGSAGAFDADLQGSLDGTNWFKLVDHTNTSGEIAFAVDKPTKFYRHIVNTLAAGDTLAIYIRGVS